MDHTTYLDLPLSEVRCCGQMIVRDVGFSGDGRRIALTYLCQDCGGVVVRVFQPGTNTFTSRNPGESFEVMKAFKCVSNCGRYPVITRLAVGMAGFVRLRFRCSKCGATAHRLYDGIQHGFVLTSPLPKKDRFGFRLRNNWGNYRGQQVIRTVEVCGLAFSWPLDWDPDTN